MHASSTIRWKSSKRGCARSFLLRVQEGSEVRGNRGILNFALLAWEASLKQCKRSAAEGKMLELWDTDIANTTHLVYLTYIPCTAQTLVYLILSLLWRQQPWSRSECVRGESMCVGYFARRACAFSIRTHEASLNRLIICCVIYNDYRIKSWSTPNTGTYGPCSQKSNFFYQRPGTRISWSQGVFDKRKTPLKSSSQRGAFQTFLCCFEYSSPLHCL